MLTITEKLPIKKMALGSMAVLVGFAGTYSMLREIFPYNSRDNLADISSERKQAASGNVIKPATDASDKESTDASKDALKESRMVVSETPSSSQPSPNVLTPATSSSDRGPITTASSATPTPAVVEPAAVTPTLQPELQPVANPLPVVEAPTNPITPLVESTSGSVINVQVKP